MDVERANDVAAFRRDAEPMLLADPARNNLPLGVLQVLLDSPEVYPVVHLWMARRDGRPCGLAIQTEPHNVLLADPLDDEAVDALVEAVIADGWPLPGVTANLPWAGRFAEHAASMTDRTTTQILHEGVWHLTEVHDVPAPPGSARPATAADRELLRSWMRAFADEALPPEHPWDAARADLDLDLRLAERGGGFMVWQDEGGPVSVSGHRVIPGVGSRIGPVYTPPEQRSRGYATRLVAEHTAGRLDAGDPACFLYTDMANPTSNAIYARIGYEKVCDAAEYSIGP
jgi:GNAT superfamily N-acetyltransferase